MLHSVSGKMPAGLTQIITQTQKWVRNAPPIKIWADLSQQRLYSCRLGWKSPKNRAQKDTSMSWFLPRYDTCQLFPQNTQKSSQSLYSWSCPITLRSCRLWTSLNGWQNPWPPLPPPKKKKSRSPSLSLFLLFVLFFTFSVPHWPLNQLKWTKFVTKA